MLSTPAGRRAVVARLLRPRQPLVAHTPGLDLDLGLRPGLDLGLGLRPAARTFASTPRARISAPREGDGPLMERRADRELPDVVKNRFRWMHTMPIFLVLVAASSVAIFNYQKSSSPVVASTLYALRTSPKARTLLGDEIYFAQRIPWIAGEMNQLQGRIDVHFAVKGSRGAARMRFTSRRPTARGVFETLEWSLETPDGRKIDLLEDVTHDPFRGIQIIPDELLDDLQEDFGLTPAAARSDQGAVLGAGALEAEKETRGFRQPTRK